MPGVSSKMRPFPLSTRQSCGSFILDFMYLLTKRQLKRSLHFAKLVAVLTGDLPIGPALVGLNLRPHQGAFFERID